MEQLLNKIKGAIYGQAVGDALGLGTEGMTDEDMAWKYPSGITHYGDIFQDRHRKRWKIGDWTDDTTFINKPSIAKQIHLVFLPSRENGGKNKHQSHRECRVRIKFSSVVRMPLSRALIFSVTSKRGTPWRE